MQEEPTADETKPTAAAPRAWPTKAAQTVEPRMGKACPGAELSGGGRANAPEIRREAAAGSANPAAE
eukprot:5829778-Lingulodinium_polyedra.AAC.1